MKAQNKIINAHRRNIREEKFLRRIQLEKIELPLPTEPLALRDYCKVPRPLDARGLIIKDVQEVDAINHPFVPMAIPKMEIKSILEKGAGLLNFFKSNVESVLP